MLNVTARQELMRTIVETVNVVVEEARLDFSKNGLEIRVVDPSHVAMIQMKIDSAAFDTWDVSDIKLGVEIKKLKEMVSLAAASELIHLNDGLCFPPCYALIVIGEINYDPGKNCRRRWIRRGWYHRTSTQTPTR